MLRRRVRRGEVHRATTESDISVEIALDGSGVAEVSTGLPFFDHMLSQLARHGSIDLVVRAVGDLDVDAHHTVEDTGICLGEALREALGDKAGIRRFASVSIPLDEALVEVSLDCSGRPYLHYEVATSPDSLPLGTPPFDPQLTEEFLRAVVVAAGLTLHVELRHGKNSHHIIEATFKALARALRGCRAPRGRRDPLDQGVL